MIFKELYCPHCGSKKIYIEDVDEYESGCCLINGKKHYIQKQIGYCEHCGRIIECEQCYEPVGYRNIQAFED